jgi:hypothetical protein
MAATSHEFEDGDIVKVTRELPDGRVVTEDIDFACLANYDGRTWLDHWLYRPDSCSMGIPIEQVRKLELVTPRSERDERDLWVG